MNEHVLFPAYIARDEQERAIRREAELVRETRASRAVLLFGQGGVGKTRLVRELARRSAGDSTTVWLDPIDIDDSEYWLLSNLERKVAGQLDPHTRYFSSYLQYLSRLPRYTRPRIGHETVVSHLGRIKRVFVECYGRFIKETGKSVVLTLDTVEAIRGMYLLVTLTQWMKALPGTLFILSGRPVSGNGNGGTEDPIRRELEDPHQRLYVTTLELAEFTQAAALDYLEASAVESGLTHDEKQGLVLLTRGHPLWLAFTVDFLREVGFPEEAARPLEEIRREVPYQDEMTLPGERMHEAFKRRLVTPYRGTDFWHEAIKRLAVVRRSVNRSIWQQVMSDLALPDELRNRDRPWVAAWEELLGTPWIRPRANRRYVTLHDAVAEELALRIIPVHDPDERWRRQLWQRAMPIYDELINRPQAQLARDLEVLDEALGNLEVPRTEGEPSRPTAEVAELFDRTAALDARKRELDQLKAARLFYQLLADFERGCGQFLTLLKQAAERHDVLFEDLIALEMQRFLPGAVPWQALGDVIGKVIDEFREWLSSTSPSSYLEIGLSMADYLINNEQPAAAAELLDRLPEANADAGQQFRLRILRGNALIRLPGRVDEGADQFSQALEGASKLTAAGREGRMAEAIKELGFYYRNVGRWQEADDAYQKARETISATLTSRSPAADREELASILTNWAYVKGLRGNFGEAHNLVESAIAMRRRLGRTQGEGISWSVRGEVYRYERRFITAWNSYQEAERIFQALRNWSWLGLIYQEQAICLHQAMREGITVIPDQREEAERRIKLALDICRDQAVRGYPSALNRAGRIFGQTDPQAALGYLKDGIEQARGLSDGRSLLSNLLDYVELSYRRLVETGQEEYRAQINLRASEIEHAISDYQFQDLQGRWHLLQGHLSLWEALDSRHESPPEEALRHYEDGFLLIAEGAVGSRGSPTIAVEFRTFSELFGQLPPETQDAWQERLRRAWAGSTSLLARLDELVLAE